MKTIDGKDYYSVKEAAALWGITESAVLKRVHSGNSGNSRNDSGTFRKVGNRIFVDITAFSENNPERNPELNPEQSGKFPENSESIPERIPEDSGQIPDAAPPVDAVTAFLQDQLEAKDAEIGRLHEEIEALHKLLDQAHQLAAMSQTKELEEPKRRRWRHGK